MQNEFCAFAHESVTDTDHKHLLLEDSDTGFRSYCWISQKKKKKRQWGKKKGSFLL